MGDLGESRSQGSASFCLAKGSATREDRAPSSSIDQIEEPGIASESMGETAKPQVTLSYTEWLAATIGANVLASEDAVAAAFKQLDASFTGKVTQADLEGAIGEAAATSILKELGTMSVSYEDFRMLARRVATKRWGIEPLQETGDESDDYPESPIGARASEGTLSLGRVISELTGGRTNSSYAASSLGMRKLLSFGGGSASPYSVASSAGSVGGRVKRRATVAGVAIPI